MRHRHDLDARDHALVARGAGQLVQAFAVGLDDLDVGSRARSTNERMRASRRLASTCSSMTDFGAVFMRTVMAWKPKRMRGLLI
jgi:hypothetical protein